MLANAHLINRPFGFLVIGIFVLFILIYAAAWYIHIRAMRKSARRDMERTERDIQDIVSDILADAAWEDRRGATRERPVAFVRTLNKDWSTEEVMVWAQVCSTKEAVLEVTINCAPEADRKLVSWAHKIEAALVSRGIKAAVKWQPARQEAKNVATQTS